MPRARQGPRSRLSAPILKYPGLGVRQIPHHWWQTRPDLGRRSLRRANLSSRRLSVGATLGIGAAARMGEVQLRLYGSRASAQSCGKVTPTSPALGA